MNALEELSGRRFDAEVSSDESNTEIGRLNRAFVQFRDRMKESEALRARQMDAERQVEIDRRNTMTRIADEFDAAVGSVVEQLFAEVQRTGDGRATLKERPGFRRGHRPGDGAASSVSENIQTVASAVQELSASINEIGQQIHVPRDIAQQTRNISTQTERRVAALSDSVEAIGSIIEIITSIAEQTNLIALNATIEGARVGDAGRGFSVVASEVKALASQTTKATEHIEAVREATRAAVDAVRDISSSINGLDEAAGAIAAAVEEQNAATSEIAATPRSPRSRRWHHARHHRSREVGQRHRSGSPPGRAILGVMRGRFEDMRHEVQAFQGRIRAA